MNFHNDNTIKSILKLKSFAISLLLLLPSFTKPMEEEGKEIQPASSPYLMPEILGIIFSSIPDVSKNQEEATAMVKAISVLNKQWNEFVNTSDFTRNFIKKSRKFKTTDLRKMLLGTKGGKRLFDELIQEMQTVFKYAIVHHSDSKEMKESITQAGSDCFKIYNATSISEVYTAMHQSIQDSKTSDQDIDLEYNHLINQETKKTVKKTVQNVYSLRITIKNTALFLYALENTNSLLVRPLTKNDFHNTQIYKEILLDALVNGSTHERSFSIYFQSICSDPEYYSRTIENLYIERVEKLFEFVEQD